MGILSDVMGWFGYVPRVESNATATKMPAIIDEQPNPKNTPAILPPKGRSSIDPSTTISGFLGTYESKQEYPLEYLHVLMKLAIYNPDFSQAVDNIKQFAATNFTVNPPDCLLYTSPSPRDGATSRMPSSA